MSESLGDRENAARLKIANGDRAGVTALVDVAERVIESRIAHQTTKLLDEAYDAIEQLGSLDVEEARIKRLRRAIYRQARAEGSDAALALLEAADYAQERSGADVSMTPYQSGRASAFASVAFELRERADKIVSERNRSRG